VAGRLASATMPRPITFNLNFRNINICENEMSF
jgi:hypothetical protein